MPSHMIYSKRDMLQSRIVAQLSRTTFINLIRRYKTTWSLSHRTRSWVNNISC